VVLRGSDLNSRAPSMVDSFFSRRIFPWWWR